MHAHLPDVFFKLGSETRTAQLVTGDPVAVTVADWWISFKCTKLQSIFVRKQKSFISSGGLIKGRFIGRLKQNAGEAGSSYLWE